MRAYQGGTFRGTKPAVSLSSARRPVVETKKLLLRTAKELMDEAKKAEFVAGFKDPLGSPVHTPGGSCVV